MPISGMQRGFGSTAGVFLLERAMPPRAHWRRPRVVRVSPDRDDCRAMAPDSDQLARRLARRSDAELLALTPSTPQAFGVFFTRHSRAIASYILRQTGDREVAADLTSETFAVALESATRYDPDKGDARGWLFGIAKITTLASYRQQRSERSARLRLGLSVPGYSDEDWEQAEDRIDAALPGLIEGVDQLPRAERRAVVARILEEREYADIAASEQATEAAIRQRVKRGLARLRKQVGTDER